MTRETVRPSDRPSKTERWLNLLAFLLDRHYPASREEILSQVSDYKEDWIGGDARGRESVRRKFERDKAELKALGVTLEPLKEKIVANHADQEVEAYQLKPRDFYLPYLKSQGRTAAHPYFLHEIAVTSNDQIQCSTGWFRQNLKGEALGAVFHEMVHVVQHYGHSGHEARDAGQGQNDCTNSYGDSHDRI